jgi:hypothetical protein
VLDQILKLYEVEHEAHEKKCLGGDAHKLLRQVKSTRKHTHNPAPNSGCARRSAPKRCVAFTLQVLDVALLRLRPGRLVSLPFGAPRRARFPH